MTTERAPTARTLKIATCGPLGDCINAERVGPDGDPCLVITIDGRTHDVLLRPADWRAFRDAVDDMLGAPRTTEDCWAHGGEADAVTVDADDLDHTKPNTIDRAQRGYEGIDAPAPDAGNADPLGHVVPGDPDPTTGVDLDDECDALADFGGSDGLGTVHCSRESGHDGQHIAGSGSMAVAVWRDDA